MTQTKKIILLVLAISFACVCACVFWYVFGTAVLNVADSNREPTREEWARSDKMWSGKYRVGDQAEMALGKWHTDSNKYGCSWRIFSYDVLDYPHETTIEAGQGKTVTLTGEADYFETEGCGTWEYDDIQD